MKFFAYIFLILLAVAFFAMTRPAYAANSAADATNSTNSTNSGSDTLTGPNIEMGNQATNSTLTPIPTELGEVRTFGEYFSKLYVWIIRVLWIAAILIGIYAGYLYMTSMGNTEAISRAKELIFGVIFGVVLLFMIEILVRTLGININPEGMNTSNTTSGNTNSAQINTNANPVNQGKNLTK